MKFSNLALSLATASSFVAAQPHRHHHRHADRHAKRDVTTVVETAYYDMSGHTMAPGAAQSGLADGSLVLVGNNEVSPAPTAPASAQATPSSSAAVNAAYAQSSSSTTSKPTSAASSAASSASSSASAAPSSSGGSSGSGQFTSSGVGSSFPDGTISCSQFPSSYGAVPLNYLNLHGWSGLQDSSKGYANTPSNPGGDCTEGFYCSYACPEGYQKSQWPTSLANGGQSVGGLFCQGGKLHLTNSALSSQLCIQGTGGVTVSNKVSQGVAVCRTDYPGTEGETIPATYDITKSSYQLTVPDESTYYQHQGKKTSAQYYVNPAGTSLQDGCQWGSASGTPNSGNWAPINLGVGSTSGTKWLSIMPNHPTNTDGTLNFNVTIKGGSGPCSYGNGQICSGSGCSALASSQGCTVSATGDMTFEFSS